MGVGQFGFAGFGVSTESAIRTLDYCCAAPARISMSKEVWKTNRQLITCKKTPKSARTIRPPRRAAPTGIAKACPRFVLLKTMTNTAGIGRETPKQYAPIRSRKAVGSG